jgi:hypothetical protein
MTTFKSHAGAVVVFAAIVWLSLSDGAGAVEFAGGTGEPNDPYQVATADQLIAIGSDPNLLDKHFVLVADIDLDPNLPGGQVFDRAVIAPTTRYGTYKGTAFSGSFDGAWHTISNLTIAVRTPPRDSSHLGLFGRVAAEGRVLRLCVMKAVISQSRSLMTSGLLCGEHLGVMRDCHANGVVSYSDYSRGAGGLVGCNGGFVFRCTAEARLSYVPWVTTQQLSILSEDANPRIVMRGGGTAAAAASPQGLGALVGGNSGVIVGCHATGSVVGSKYSSSMGGIAGLNEGDAIVGQCYCALSGSARACVGRGDTGTVANSYYLRDPVKSDSGSEYGIGLTDSEMRRQASFPGWDFAGLAEDGTSDIWVVPADGSYPVLAAERSFDLEGNGTEAVPFLIGSVQDLGVIVQRPAACYRLREDIDCSGIVWPAMLTPWFAGRLEGAGHTISHVELYTTGPGGLLGRVMQQATIRGLRLDDVHIPGSEGSRFIGALACINAGAIVNCSAAGQVGGRWHVGGLVGKNDGAICSCRADVAVIGAALAYNLGGLNGFNRMGVVVSCQATGAVVAQPDSQNIGGLIGGLGVSGGEVIDRASVVNCGSLGSVAGGRAVGGLIGYSAGQVLNCYSAGSVEASFGTHGSVDAGGLIGAGIQDLIVHSYFLDPNDGGGPDNGLGERLSVAQMSQMESFAGWDFVGRSSDGFANAWSLPPGASYPLPTALSRELLPVLEGRGTVLSPYLIRSPAGVRSVSQEPAAHYRLDADIDLGRRNHPATPIPLFLGHLDGAGHSISGLAVTCSRYGGLFGIIHNRASVRDLSVTDATVVGTGEGPIGILAGVNKGTLVNCYVQGDVRGDRYAGGLAGIHAGSAVMTRCRADVTIQTRDGTYVGGLVGICRDATLSECCAVATIQGEDYLQATGGLAGDVTSVTIARCFALGQIQGGIGTWHLGGLVGNLTNGAIFDSYAGVDIVMGAKANRVGGLVGDVFGSDVARCYAQSRILVGEESGPVGGFSGSGVVPTTNFWDRQTSGLEWSPGARGLTTGQMQQAATFIIAGWDFDETWTICEGKDYPRLAWEQVLCE